jgi:hypothetical protein
LEVITHFIATGALTAGDVLVMDNATVHSSIIQHLMALLDAAHVRALFLPKYSPGSPPATRHTHRTPPPLTQNWTRASWSSPRWRRSHTRAHTHPHPPPSPQHLYYYRGTERFWVEIAKGLAKVTWEHVVNYYRKCVVNALPQ